MADQWISMFLKNPKILVVEDDKFLAGAVAKLLEKIGASTQAAHDGNAALVAAGKFDPDLILCDLGIPYLRGDEVLKALRKQGFEKPFILLTGAEDRDTLISALRNQAFDYLLKPFCADLLLASVQKALRQESTRVLREAETECLYEALSRFSLPEEGTTWRRWGETAARQRVAASRRKAS